MATYRFKTKPYKHQRRALKWLLANDGGGLQVPMRWGKTKVAIDFANCLHLREGIQRVLVVCPLSVVGVWEAEIPKHTPDALLGNLVWQVVNYEQLYSRASLGGRDWCAIPNKALETFNADLIVLDEAHRIGNPNTLASKHAFRLGRRARFRLIMTGTMFHRKPFYVFGQAKFYDPSIFGTAFGTFCKRIAIMGGPSGKEVVRYINLKWMMRRMRRFVYIEKYVPARPPAVNTIYFPLSGKGKETYKEMERRSVIDVEGEEVISPIVISRHLRCQQIAGGWVKTATTYRRVGRDLLDMATERFQDYADADIPKVVVGCRFLPELTDAAKAAKAAGYATLLFHGGLTRVERDRRIAVFKRTARPVAFIAQVSTGSMGIDLSVADTMMFYSLDTSFLTHDQFSRRIEKYQESRVLQYDYLIPKGTRTEVTYEALQLGQDVAKYIADDPRRVERITAKSYLEPTDKPW